MILNVVQLYCYILLLQHLYDHMCGWLDISFRHMDLHGPQHVLYPGLSEVGPRKLMVWSLEPIYPIFP